MIITKNCKICNAEFVVTNSTRGRKYCGKDIGCKPKPTQKKAKIVSKDCIFCGKSFDLKEGYIYKQKFCHPECRYESYKLVLKGRK